MRVGIAGEEANENSSKEPPRVDRRAARRLENELGHVVVGRFVFIIARALAEQLVEFFEMAFGAARQAIKALHHQCSFIDAFEVRNFRLGDLVTWQQGAARDGGQIFVLDDVAQRPRRQLCNKGRSLVTPRRPISGALLDREELRLNAGERSPACKCSHCYGIAEINIMLGCRRGIDDRDSSGAIVTERKKQGEAVVRINFERACLSIAKPALRDQVVKEGVKSLFADVWSRLAGEGKSNRRMAGFEICGIVGEPTASAGLLLQLTREEIIVVDFAPE